MLRHVCVSIGIIGWCWGCSGASTSTPNDSTRASAGAAAVVDTSEAQGGLGNTDPNRASAGTAGRDVSRATGGESTAGGTSASGGASASGGTNASGGSSATGGAVASGGTGGAANACIENGALRPEVKQCASDADCELAQTYSCCGAGLVVGFAKGQRGCFVTSYPSGCPALGCASVTTTEDHQYVSAPINDLSSVSVHCVDLAAGQRACMTTLKDSSLDHLTPCHAGSTSENACGASCTCVDGTFACEKPVVGTACEPSASCSYYDASSQKAVGSCTCSGATSTWACSP